MTTDFGLSDHYVGAVKGAILSINPEATIIDITHDVTPQAIEQGAFLLSCALPYFPRDSVHLAVVDPGVGTERRALAVCTRDGVFIGPDNGVLSAALSDEERDAALDRPRPVPLGDGRQAFVLSNPHYRLTEISATFHARDIFGPAAAHLSLGVNPAEFGPGVREIVALPPFRAAPADGGVLVGRIVHIDRFGNVMTTIRSEQLPPADVLVDVGGELIRGLCRSYADRNGALVLIGSSGFLEVAVNGGSAADSLGLRIGDPVTARTA